MTAMCKWISEPVAKGAARFLKGVCWFLMGFFALCLVLSILGRQTFVLHTSTGTYDRAIYAEENHEPASRGLTVGSSDNVYVLSLIHISNWARSWASMSTPFWA